MKPTAVMLSFFLVACSTGSENPADLILHNAVVWTGETSQPRGQAVAIRDGKVVAVGSNEDALRHRGQNTQVIDLAGKFVTPGFNDNHTHFASAARFLEFNIMKTSSQEEFVERVHEVASNLKPGEWITAGGWGAYDQWAAGSAGGEKKDPFAPDISRVEDITKDIPMFINKFDNSEYAMNTAAVKALGLDPKNPKAPKVQFARNGILKGDGVRDLLQKVPRHLTKERRVHQTLKALEEIRKHGVTNISDMSDDVQLEIFRELHAKGQLTVRVHYRFQLADLDKVTAQGVKVRSGDPWIRLGAVKGHIDGIMGTSSARFFEPYSHDPKNRGRWRPLVVDEKGDFVPGKFVGYMANADKAGLQLSVHAIGDEANSVLLDYLDELNNVNGKRDRRFRLVHAQVIASKDFPRFREHGIIAEVQPFHLSDDMRWMEERIGHERSKGAYAFKSLKDAGAMLSFGTDWPGTTAAEYPINPMLGLYAAVTRQTVTGQPSNGWFPDERISVEDALRAYTYCSAYANFEEESKGSLKVGKLADLTVLSKNLLEIDPKDLLTVETLYTIVDGKIVYEKKPSS